MPANRISTQIDNRMALLQQVEAVQATSVNPGLVMVPAIFVPVNDPWQASRLQELYRAAYDQARITVAARKRIRNFTFLWN